MGLASTGITSNHRSSLFKSAPRINGQIRSFLNQIKDGIGVSAPIKDKGVLTNASFEGSGKGVLTAGGVLSKPSIEPKGKGIFSNRRSGGARATANQIAQHIDSISTGKVNLLA